MLLMAAALASLLAAPSAVAAELQASVTAADDIRCIEPAMVACGIICAVDRQLCARDIAADSKATDSDGDENAPPPCPGPVRRICIMVCRGIPVPLCRIL